MAAAAALLLLAACGTKQELRSAVERAAPVGAVKVGCDYSDEFGEFPLYVCNYRVHAHRTSVALATTRRLDHAGFTVACDSAVDDAIDITSLGGDVRVVARIEPQGRPDVTLEISGSKANRLTRDLIEESPGCAPLRVKHLGNAPCIGGWNTNTQARELARELGVRPKVLVWGGPTGCSFYFLTRHRFVLVEGSWRGNSLTRIRHRPLYRWEDDERRAYARSASTLVRPNGTLASQAG